MTFVDDVLRGRATLADFDAHSEAWNDSAQDLGAFHDYAGLLWPEYALWATDHDHVSGEEVLAYVIAARRHGAGLLDHLRAVRSHDPTAAEIYRLCRWWAEDWAAVSQHYPEDRPDPAS
ncbi:hypothetical protein AB0J21_33115 [Streptomyces sp. NPDC049954]|uniref:hypothetical protein n=1 Tax=Streptomyces sp. NPDC049954 TaxID=3155779 RepID=UPI00341882F2